MPSARRAQKILLARLKLSTTSLRKIVITILTAIAGTLGVMSCTM
ncbi:MAG: smalltalk protein [Bacteroidaceae bacterium]|nr:smalltalk protein [Bacteroidaceae bacterium]